MRYSSTIENAIYDWVNSLFTNTTVIWDKQDVETPSGDYITLNIITAGNVEVATPLPKNPVNTGKIQYKTFEKMTLSINVFSQTDYLGKMAVIQRACQFSSTREMLKASGLYIRSCSNIVDLSSMVDTGWEFRCQMDIFLAYSALTDMTVYPITKIAGTINDINFFVGEQEDDDETE